MYNTPNWRGQFITDLVKDLQFSSYLELGVADGNCCWHTVQCPLKIGVDSTNDTVWKVPEVLTKTTDEYFDSLDESSIKFDIIFIDAKHEKNQVLKDFLNSLRYLNKNGIIIFHDVYPLQESDIISNACGDVYEFWISLVDSCPDKTSIFIGNPGDIEGTVGIYFNDGGEFNPEKFNEMNYTFQYFSENIDIYINSKKVDYNQIIQLHKDINEK